MLRAKNIMTTQVVTIGPDGTVNDVVMLMMLHRISAVPVVDGGKLIGIISEGDLIRRAEIGTTSRHRHWWLKFLTGGAALASEYTKSHSVRVVDVMTKKVVTVTEDATLAEIAELFEERRIKRVPVTRNGQVVGIVSRANLVHAIAIAPDTSLLATWTDDHSIRDQVLKAMKAEPWASIGSTDITVSGGVVAFWGAYLSEEEREASHVLAENIPGVRKVEDHRVPVEIPYGTL